MKIDMENKLQDMLKQEKVLIMDGSMGTALENLGANLNNKLWTARVLADRPDLVKQVHLDYFRAGADMGITCSYQASIPGLLAAGFTEAQAEELIQRAITVFKEARQEWWDAEGQAQGRLWPLCLAAVGPYGAYLANGAEYKGHYGLTDEELRGFHKRRMELLWAAGPDVLLMETQPSLQEVLVETALAEELGAPYWVTFSCQDGRRNCEGDLLSHCAEVLVKNHPHLQAIGVNCTKPEYIESLIGELKAVTELPIVVYPNSGEEYDPVTKTWRGTGGRKRFGSYAADYMRAGAAVVGGCCTTVAEHIEQVVEAREKQNSPC